MLVPALQELNVMDESSLIQAARRGDLDAFNLLVLKYQDVVFNQASWMLKDRQSAEDFTQDTFIQAYRKLPGYRNGSFRAWLVRIVTNACLDELRRRKRRPLVPLEPLNQEGEEVESVDWLADPGPSVEDRLEQADLSGLLQCQMDQLPADHRAVLVLVDLQDFDYEEAAAALGVPVGTVKSRLARARTQLRKRLADHPAFLSSFGYPIVTSANALRAPGDMV
jgi:RNA polymerase sigma-70 factor, ECF subfamily